MRDGMGRSYWNNVATNTHKSRKNEWKRLVTVVIGDE